MIVYFTSVNRYIITYVTYILLTFVKLKFTAMKDRLQRFLELEQLTPSRLADILGIQRSGLSHILSGRNKPGFDFIQKLIIKFPTLNSEWLLTGKGKVYKESTPAPFNSSHSTFTPAENNLFASDNKIQKRETINYSDEEIINEPVKLSAELSELPENSINEQNKPVTSEKKNLKKIIMIYSDGTFAEYIPGKE